MLAEASAEDGNTLRYNRGGMTLNDSVDYAEKIRQILGKTYMMNIKILMKKLEQFFKRYVATRWLDPCLKRHLSR